MSTTRHIVVQNLLRLFADMPIILQAVLKKISTLETKQQGKPVVFMSIRIKLSFEQALFEA